MAEKQTSFSTTIDFDRDGKQYDFVRVSHSVHRSAYGWLPVPLASIKNCDGPTVLLTAGVHGDEYEGQITLTRLIQDIKVWDVSGRIIILPMANYPAAKAGLRNSPVDGLNLNRVFPGDAYGTTTLALAHFIDSVLMPLANYLIDLHSGGSSMMYLPTVILAGVESGIERSAEKINKKLELARVFGSPYGFFFPSGQGKMPPLELQPRCVTILCRSAPRWGVMVPSHLTAYATVKAESAASCAI